MARSARFTLVHMTKCMQRYVEPCLQILDETASLSLSLWVTAV